MPVFDSTPMQSHGLDLSHYGYSAARIDTLAAAEYTLVGIAADVSASVDHWRDDIERAVGEVIRACRHSPRAANLLVRLVTFSSTLREVHGFSPLSDCDPDAYRGQFRTGGVTALYDAGVNLSESLHAEGERLRANAFSCNAIVFVITDGMDNASRLDAHDLATAMGALNSTRALDAVQSVLIGVDVNRDDLSSYLTNLRRDAKFDRYVELDDASESTLSSLAAYVSRSIVAHSTALGSGRPGASVRF